ncbi:hypothetical protein, partial [Streptococcus pneumoniae]|uniref:hypothetical protein n=1 Tax=Streptococcus pneumoniae TaxID=1313 RepID=UPI0018B04589
KVLRIGSGASSSKLEQDRLLITVANPQGVDNGKSKPVTTDKQPTAAPTARASKKNYQGPASLNAGAATRRQG